MNYDLSNELMEIGKLINSVSLIMAVRKEVRKARKAGYVVMDGRQCGREEYDVVVTSSDIDKVTRRIRKGMPDVDIEKIAENLIGINGSRRMRNGE